MKATLIILTMLASALAASAQQPVTATTEDGRKVLLYPNGQWRLLRATGPQVDHSVSQVAVLSDKHLD
jgi:predicted porin